MIIFKPFSLVSALLLLIPAYAFAWNNGNSFSYSSLAATAVISSSSGTSVTPSYQGISTSSDSYSYYTSQGITIPDSFMSILNKLDISQSVVPSEATIQNALKSAKDLNSKPLEGNAYKDQLIAPLCSILDSGKFSTDTTSLVLENLEMIAQNDKIDSEKKLKMIDPLINFTEKSIQSKTYTDRTLMCFHNSLREIFSDSQVSPIDKDKLANKLLNQSSSLWSENISIHSVLLALEGYLPTEDTSLKIKNTIIRFDQKMLSLSGADSDLTVINEIVRSLASVTQDSRLDKSTLLGIASSVQGWLDNPSISLSYSMTLSCLATLDSIAQNKNLDNTPEKNKIIDQIVSCGVNTQNKAIWEKYGVLVLVKPEVADLVNEALWQKIDTAIANIPADKRPTIISLQDVMSDGNKQESLSNVGSYDSAISTIDLKVNQALPFKNTYVYHEAGHHLQANAMTKDQISKWDELWLQSDGIEDFVEEYSTTNKDEDYATMMETVLNEYFLPDNQKTVLNRAKEQNKANDPTLLNKYLLAEDYWGIESSNTN